MHIAITGASGFVGQAVVEFYLSKQAKVTVIGRDAAKLQNIFKNTVSVLTWDADVKTVKSQLHDCDLIINLAGENVAASRWSEALKQELLQSRKKAAATLTQWYQQLEHKPDLLIASAASFYGSYVKNKKTYTEDDAANNNCFLAEVAVTLEEAYQAIKAMDVRVVFMRFGLVFDLNGGMLKALASQFKFGLGSIIAGGQQEYAWVALTDIIRAIEFLREHKELHDGVNVIAPEIVTQATFAKEYAAFYHRPCFMRVPAALLQMLIGKQRAIELMLMGTRAAPKKLTAAGFKFNCSTLKEFFKSQKSS